MAPADPGLDIGVASKFFVRGHGEGRVALELAHHLVERGNRVTVYGHEFDEDLRPLVVTRHVAAFPGPQALDDLWSILVTTRHMRKAEHDAVCLIGHGARPDVPYVYDARFSHEGWRATWRPGSRPGLFHRANAHLTVPLEKLCIRHAARVIASSDRLAAEVARHARAPVDVVPDGTDLEEFGPVTADERHRSRLALALDAKDFVVAFVGEYKTTRKGLDPLLQALALGAPGERLVVAGEGPRGQLEARAEALGIADRLAIVGFAPAGAVLAAADVTCVPSSYEPFSLVALESAARAVPVVVSAAAGVATYLGEGAVVVQDPGDPSQLRAALDRLRSSPEGRRAMGVAGRRAAEGLPWRATMEATATIVEAVAGARRRVER